MKTDTNIEKILNKLRKLKNLYEGAKSFIQMVELISKTFADFTGLSYEELLDKVAFNLKNDVVEIRCVFTVA